MAGHTSQPVGQPGKFEVTAKMKTLFAIFMFIGASSFIVTLINDPKRAWYAYVIGFFYFVSLALGGLFFTSVQHFAKAGWSVNIRRFSESFASFLPVSIVFGIGLLLGAPVIYEWLHPEVVAADHLLQHKAPYLNQTFFCIRTIIFFVMWVMFAKWIVGGSLKQDKNGDSSITQSLVGKAIAFTTFFAFSYSFFSVDTLMSLQPHWFSTIFGVYTFAGLFQSTLAFMILFIIFCVKKGLLKGFVDDNHIHDLGKFLFAFTVFWAYIAFSQYMLLWYANLPEETIFLVPRSQGEWLYVSVALIIFKFIVPFLALLPRWAKRNYAHLAAVSILILAMQYVDLMWLSYPTLDPDEVKFSLTEIGTFVGFLGVFMFTVTKFLSKNSLVPVKDPRIEESLHHHVVY